MAIPRAIVGPTTRFRSGVTNVPVGVTMGNYIAMDPTRVHEYFEDFDSNFDITIATPIGWTITTSNGGAATIKTGVVGGRVNLATGAASTNALEAQSKSNGFAFDKTKRMFMKYLIQCDVISTTDIVVGLQVINTTPQAANTQGIYFNKATGGLTGVVSVSNGTSTTTSTAVATLANATDISIGIAFDPLGVSDTGTIGCFKLFVNDVQQPQKLPATNAPTGFLAPVLYVKTNTAAIANMQVDYILNTIERFEPSVL